MGPFGWLPVVGSDRKAWAVTATVPSSPAPSRGAGLLRRRDVRLLLAGQAASELGSQVGSIALPLVAVLGLGASPLQVGVLTAAGTISFAVGGLPAGVWVDRLPRRPVLVGADLVRGCCSWSTRSGWTRRPSACWSRPARPGGCSAA